MRRRCFGERRGSGKHAQVTAEQNGRMLERNYADVWEALAGTIPTATALVQGTTRRSWEEFEARSARLAGAFAAAGVGRNSKVALYLYNGPEYLEAFFATLKLRAVPVNVNY